jgi:alpha-L-rhamnosidase
MEIINLKCEYKTNPVGIDVEQPRLSWQLVSENKNSKLRSYRILAVKEFESGLKYRI